jgi:hypothetical protein
MIRPLATSHRQQPVDPSSFPLMDFFSCNTVFQVPIHCQCEDYGEKERTWMNLDPLFSRELQEIDGRPRT